MAYDKTRGFNLEGFVCLALYLKGDNSKSIAIIALDNTKVHNETTSNNVAFGNKNTNENQCLGFLDSSYNSTVHHESMPI